MSGYVDCACRDCFEIAIGTAGEALCHACRDAGCEAGEEQECKSPSAYGYEEGAPDAKETIREAVSARLMSAGYHANTDLYKSVMDAIETA